MFQKIFHPILNRTGMQRFCYSKRLTQSRQKKENVLTLQVSLSLETVATKMTKIDHERKKHGQSSKTVFLQM